ncbi:hypothetical protein [Arthrobacter sp. NPDC092385]|uniref:hypothetical protein n=1 Tax=Arthrobacter sp. NPDC092385 TaxID=3363943 RepID=UPI003820157D
MNSKQLVVRKFSTRLAAVAAVLAMTFGTASVPASAASKTEPESKHYVLKGAPELLTSDQFGTPVEGETHNFVINNRTGETYYMGTGPVDKFKDKKKALYAEQGVTYVDPATDMIMMSVSPWGCSPGGNFCMYRRVANAVGINGYELTYGSWYNVYRVSTATGMSARWYEIGSSAPWTMGPGKTTDTMYQMNVGAAQNY